MGVVAIHTTNSFVKHFTLHIGSIDINFIIDLTVHMISRHLHVGRPRLYDLRKKMIEKGIIRMMARMDKSATGMAFGTRFNLGDIAAIHIGQSKMGKTIPTLIRPGKFHMFTPRAMTGFAGNIHFRVGSGESLRRIIKFFPEICGMAISTHVIPVLHGTGPKKWIIRGNSFIWI